MKKVFLFFGFVFLLFVVFLTGAYAQVSLKTIDIEDPEKQNTWSYTELVEVVDHNVKPTGISEVKRDYMKVNGPAASQLQEFDLGMMRFVLSLAGFESSVIEQKISKMRENLLSRKVLRGGGSVSAPIIQKAWEDLASDAKVKGLKIDITPLVSTEAKEAPFTSSISSMQKSVKKYVDYVNAGEETIKTLETEGAKMKESAKNIKCSSGSTLSAVPQAQTDLTELESKVQQNANDIALIQKSLGWNVPQVDDNGNPLIDPVTGKQKMAVQSVPIIQTINDHLSKLEGDGKILTKGDFPEGFNLSDAASKQYVESKVSGKANQNDLNKTNAEVKTVQQDVAEVRDILVGMTAKEEKLIESFVGIYADYYNRGDEAKFEQKYHGIDYTKLNAMAKNKGLLSNEQ